VVNTLDDSILRSLRRIVRGIDIYSHHLASRYSLTGPQLVCLRHLSKGGEMPAGDLAEGIVVSQPTVSGILDRLEARGLVRRTRDKQDRRRVLVALTAAGEALVRAAPTPLQQRFAERLAALPTVEQEDIDRGLRRVVEMMEAQALDAAPMLTLGPLTADPGGGPSSPEPGTKPGPDAPPGRSEGT
jgi:DNA-binding MarR family transcriptional regulator